MSERVNRVCQRCGRDFQLIPSRLLKQRGKFCGIGCSRPFRNDADRFWSKVAKAGPDDCWLWTAAVLRTGYGAFNRGGTTERSHRLAWEFTHSPITDGLMVCHQCDVRLCCNPAHLFLGAAVDNVADMHAKGRASKEGRRKGQDHHNAKLDADKVREIRRRYVPKYGACEALAREFGVTRRVIYQIVRGLTWTHVTSP